MSNKIDFKLKSIKRGHFILITGKLYHNKVPILDIYVSYTRTYTCVKETLLNFKSYFKPHTLIVGDFNTLLSTINGSARQKFNKEIKKKLTDVTNLMDIIDIYRTIPQNTNAYTFFLTRHGIFPKIDHILGHKTNLNVYKK